MLAGRWFYDRRLPFLAVVGDCIAGAMSFPVAMCLVPSSFIAGEDTLATLAVLPFAMLLLTVLITALDPPEPPVWNLPRAVLAGIWRATLLFMALLWILIFTAAGSTLPMALFVTAWAILALANSALRALRLATACRITL
jgi:hypothetical protein